MAQLATMAGDLGLGRKLSKVELSLGRMARFRLLIAERLGPELLIPTALRPLTDAQLDQLRPDHQHLELVYRTGHPAALPLPARPTRPAGAGPTPGRPPPARPRVVAFHRPATHWMGRFVRLVDATSVTPAGRIGPY